MRTVACDVDDSADTVMLSLGMTIEGRDPYTIGHCRRVAQYATALGRFLQLPEHQIEALYRGGFLHDVGKIGLPDEILFKAGPLTPHEEVLMRQHTVIGDRLCSEFRALQAVRPIVRSHHERRDGSGYPDGLVGDEIPLSAQILAIADAYDAMTTDRPYRRALTSEQALASLDDDVRKGWRRGDLVVAFGEVLAEGRLARRQMPMAKCQWAKPAPEFATAI